MKGNGNGKRNGKKTPPKTPMRVPEHGNGKLLVGNPGNVGGGRPPSVIRNRCRGSFDERIPVLEAIADGEPTERIEVPLSLILQHAHCPKCDGKLQANDALTLGLVSITAKTSPRAGDRTKAVDALGKYGLGDASGLDVDEVRDKLARSLDLIEALCPPALGKQIVAALEPVWDA